MASIAELLESDCVVLMQSTIPPAMTIAEWRRIRTKHRVGTRRAPRWRRLPAWGR